MASNKEIDVTVTGSDYEGVQLVTGVINKALLDNNFNNVGVMHPHTGEPTLVPDVPSLFDLIRHEKPHLFSQPVRVTGLTIPEGDLSDYLEKHQEIIEKHPDSALARHLSHEFLANDGEEHKSDKKDEPKKHRKPKAEPQPTAAELSDAARTMSKAAHKDDHQPAKDVRGVAEKLAAKALDAA